jgi:hypothetical protein
MAQLLAFGFCLAAVAAQSCSAPGKDSNAVDFVFVLAREIYTANTSASGLLAFVASQCGPNAVVTPRFATVVFTASCASVVHDFKTCDEIEDIELLHSAWTPPFEGTAVSEHAILTGIINTVPSISEALSLRKKGDTHIVFTPRDTVASPEALEAYLALSDARRTFSFFVETSQQALLKFGDPKNAVAYTDGSHFNKVALMYPCSQAAGAHAQAADPRGCRRGRQRAGAHAVQGSALCTLAHCRLPHSIAIVIICFVVPCRCLQAGRSRTGTALRVHAAADLWAPGTMSVLYDPVPQLALASGCPRDVTGAVLGLVLACVYRPRDAHREPTPSYTAPFGSDSGKKECMC